MPCDTPPELFSSIRASLSTFPSSFFAYPMERGFRSFKHSAAALIFIIIAIVAASREVARALSITFGIAPGILTAAVAIYLIEIYRRAGFQCTVWAWMTMFIVVIQGSSLLGRTADTTMGKALGLDELPAAAEPVDPRLNCMRLAACQASPVFSHHEMAKEKINACEKCVTQGKLFESVWKDEDGVQVFGGYKCSDRDAPVRQCPPEERSSCEATRDALELMGESTEPSAVSAMCKKSSGKLCHVARHKDGYRGYAGPVSFDETSVGLGYPNEELCQKHNPRSTCVQLPGCIASDVPGRGTNCFCDQYKTRRANNPCTFLESKCDMGSPLYAEAKLQIAQQSLDVSDIIDGGDVRNLVKGIDKALGFVS